MTDHKIDIAILFGLMVAGLTPNEEFRIWIMCGIGGIFSGFVGSELFPVGSTDYRKRWAMNAVVAFMFAPFATLYVQSLVVKHIPSIEVPLPFIAIATSAVLGIVGVSALSFGIPYLKRRYGKQSKKLGAEDE